MEKDLYKKKYVRYAEGVERYSMSRCTFMKIAREANAVSRIGNVSIVNTEILERYIFNFQKFYYSK